jgi:UDP-glucuronate decarboxylase
MRILVTGGAGFIGSHLIDRLMGSGHEVICLDNFFTGRKQNVLHWLNSPNFELIRHDVTEPIRLEVDQIYHLACPASPVHYQYNPVKTIKTNVMGTLHMLGLAKRVNARFLLASTSEVYGDPEVHPQSEDYRGNVNTIGPRSCYDEGKRVAETLAFDYNRQNNVQIRVARIFNTYGPRMLENDGRVVSNFIVQALKDDAITVYGDGSQTRSFCYVSDLVEGLIRLMNGDCIGPVNLGNPDEHTVLQLAQKIQGMVNPGADIQFKPLPQDDPRRRQPNISLAKEALGWEPTIMLVDGLQKTIEDFRSRMEGTPAVPAVPYVEV